MDSIPGPVALHFGRDGFKHESSADIYDWVNYVVNTREQRISSLKDMDYTIDTHNRKRVTWEGHRRDLQKPVPIPRNTDQIKDYSEVDVIRRVFNS